MFLCMAQECGTGSCWGQGGPALLGLGRQRVPVGGTDLPGLPLSPFSQSERGQALNTPGGRPLQAGQGQAQSPC